MKLSAPKVVTWVVAVIAGVVGSLQHFHVLHIDALAQYSVHLIIFGFGLLALATLFKKL